MEYSSVLSEICHDGHICMEPVAFQNFRTLMFSNIELRAKVEETKKEHAEKMVIGTVESDGDGGVQVKSHTADGSAGQQYIFPSDAFSPYGRNEFYKSLNADDEVVNVVTIAGPMTRGGGACSYGSIDHRNLIVEAADIPQVRTHILVARTPGGMASTLRDYRYAINYAHQRGQKVYMLCDGDVASGGAFAGTICDGIYAVNPDDSIGSLGMYCAFFTQKDGDTNTISQETYHEYYASASKDKNAWYRAASEGDMTLIAEEVEKDLAQLLANVRADRPKVRKEQLTGKMYRMADVKGTLIDGFTSLPELALMALKEWHKRNGAALPMKNGAKVNGGKTADINANEDGNKTQNQNNMKTYQKLGNLAGLEVGFEQQADGYVSLSEEQADTMEAALATAQTEKETAAQSLADAQAQVEGLTTEKENLTQQLAEAQNKITELQNDMESKEQELNEAKTSAQTSAEETQTAHETALAEKQTTIDELQKQLDEAKSQISTHEATIADLNAKIAELNESAGAKQNGGGAPENNGRGEGTFVYSSKGKYDPNLSPMENKRNIEAYNKELQAMQANR